MLVKSFRYALPLTLAAALLSPLARAQQAPQPPSTQQQMREQMQELRMKIMENMQKQGIDPREFVRGMMEKMQDGSFDINDFNQELIDKGLIDQETLTRVQNNLQKLSMQNIKEQLGATDQEWTVIEQKIAQLLAARNRLSAGNPFTGPVGGMGAFMTAQSGPNDLAVAMRELRVLLRDKNATNEAITAKLQAVRDAREKAQAEVAAAQKDLEDILTMRQEATLFRMGLIQ